MKKKIAMALCCVLILNGCSDQTSPIPNGESSSPPSASGSAPDSEPSSVQEEEQSNSQQESESNQQESSSSEQNKPQAPQVSEPEKKPQPPVQEQKPEVNPPEETDPYITKLTDIIYKGVNTGPLQRKFIYPVDSTWTSTVLNYSYDTGGQAHLSWKVSWILEGLDHAYRATGDRMFLDTSIEMYDALLSKRDDNIGRPAWNDEVYPLWGSTSRYNGAEYTLYDVNGNTAAELEFNCQANDQTYVSVLNCSGTSFDIKIKHKDTIYSIKNLTLDTLESRIKEINWTYYGSPLTNKKVVSAKVLNSGSANLAEHEFIRVDNTNVPTVIHTALILEPMVNTYIEMKKLGHSKTQSYKDEIELMFDTMLKLNWNERGYFAECQNSPTHLGGGYIIPWNQQLPLISAMANYAADENNELYKGIVRKFCSYFMTKVKATDKGYLWKYWEDPSGTVTYYETTNYGGIDLSAIASIYNSGVAFTEKNMDMFAATIRGRILKTPSKPSSRIDGSSPNSSNIPLLYKYLPFSGRVSIINILKNQSMEWENASRMLYYYQR